MNDVITNQDMQEAYLRGDILPNDVSTYRPNGVNHYKVNEKTFTSWKDALILSQDYFNVSRKVFNGLGSLSFED